MNAIEQFKYISSVSQIQILSSYAWSPQAPHSTRVLFMGLHYCEGRCNSASCLYTFIYFALKDEMREEGGMTTSYFLQCGPSVCVLSV